MGDTHPKFAVMPSSDIIKIVCFKLMIHTIFLLLVLPTNQSIETLYVLHIE